MIVDVVETDKDIAISEDGSLQWRVWVKRGGMLVNRECLDHDDPMHPYNFIASHGLRPEDYGVMHPLAEEYKHMSRDQLIAEIVSMRREVDSLMRAGFL